MWQAALRWHGVQQYGGSLHETIDPWRRLGGLPRRVWPRPAGFFGQCQPAGSARRAWQRPLRQSLATADRYPDPLCRALREKLAVAEGVPAEWLLCGNGAADLIFRLALAEKPRTALVTAPTFAEYATALGTVDCRVERHFLQEENDFAVTDAILECSAPGHRSGVPLSAQQPHRSAGPACLCGGATAQMRGRGCSAGRGRMLSGFSARGAEPFRKAAAEHQQEADHSESLHQALRHGGRASGLLPVRR